MYLELHTLLDSQPDTLNVIREPSHHHMDTFPKRQILESSKPKDLADDNFTFDKKGREFSFFPQCFQKTCTINTKKPGLVLEGLNFL